MGWRMDGYVKCPECGEENDGAALFGDSNAQYPLGIYNGITSVEAEPCWGCGKRIKITLTCET
jgi:hypothetical protein